jgi:hypothetical protein
LAKEAQLPAQFLGPNKEPIRRFEVPINLMDSSKFFNALKIRFKSSTMALTKLTSFGVAVEATILAVEVEV